MRDSSSDAIPLRCCFKKKQTSSISFIFFFNDTATTEIYTLSLHDALPISVAFELLGDARLRFLPFLFLSSALGLEALADALFGLFELLLGGLLLFLEARDNADRKSTRLNSSHQIISYPVFCLKKKKLS